MQDRNTLAGKPREEEQEELLALRRQRIFGIASIVLIIVISLFLGWLIGKPLVEAVRNKESFRAWINAQGFLKYFIMVGLMVLQIIIAIIPGGPIEVAAGFAFGTWMGTFVCMIGAVLGSALVFWLARRYGIKLVRIFVPREKMNSIKLLRQKGKLNLVLFIVFIVPGMPKDILTYMAGLTPIRMSDFLIITGVARFPAILLSAMGGHSLGEKQFGRVALITGTAIVLGGLMSWLYRRYSKQNEKEEGEDKPDV